jgi:hypothetical protein
LVLWILSIFSEFLITGKHLSGNVFISSYLELGTMDKVQKTADSEGYSSADSEGYSSADSEGYSSSE